MLPAVTCPDGAGGLVISSGQIIAGSTWNVQFWYRDPSGGPVGFNFSNALRISFCE